MSGPSFVEKVRGLSASLDDAGLPYAIGGALALAYCVGSPRATADIDVNVFIPADDPSPLVAALPQGVTVRPEDVALLRRDGQARLWWDKTPVDVFLTNVSFHTEVATRVRVERWDDQEIRFLDCGDLAVFKAFFDRSKDWVDLEEMVRARTIDVPWVLGTLVEHLGGDDPRVERLRSLAARTTPRD